MGEESEMCCHLKASFETSIPFSPQSLTTPKEIYISKLTLIRTGLVDTEIERIMGDWGRNPLTIQFLKQEDFFLCDPLYFSVHQINSK
jgi:hypothetical protein